MKDFVCGRPWLDRSLIYRDASSNKIKYHKVRIRPIRFNPYWPSIISVYFKRNINLSTVSLSCTFDTLFFLSELGTMTAISTMQFEQRFTLSKNAENLYIPILFFPTNTLNVRQEKWLDHFLTKIFCAHFFYCMISRLVHWVWIMFFIQ